MAEIQIDSRVLFYDEQGQGAPLVFLSGLGGDHRAFSVSARHFSTSYRVLTIDHRDVGRSSRVVQGYETRDLAADVARWLGELRVGRAHVVGHSLGGLVAQELALEFPECVQSLVLASTHAGANEWRKAVIESWIEQRKIFSPGQFTTLTLPWLVAPVFYKNANQVAGMVRFAETNEFAQDPDAFERQARAAAEFEARDRLPHLQVPTLVLSGELDIVNPPSVARELASSITGSEIAFLPNVGHLPHIEDGVNFRRIVGEFISRQI